MSKVISIIGGVIVITIIAFLIFTGFSNEKEGMMGMASIRAPDFSLEDYSGQIVTLADFSGKPLVINSWAAWCPFCKKELVDFVTVQKEFGDKFVIIAIDRAESLETAKKYTDELGVTDDLIFLLDSNDSFYRSIGGFSMPETIFVDKEGRIQIHKRGPMDLGEIRDKIQAIL